MMIRRCHLAAVALVFLCGALQGRDADWPRFRGPQGDGTWNPVGLPKDLKTLEPRRVWTHKVGGGYGGVTVSGGRVYVMDRVKEPEEQERVLCYDLHSGDLVWTHSYPVSYAGLDYGNGPRASVTLEGDRAYTLGAKGVAACLDAKTGKVIWQQDTVETLGAEPPRWGYAGSPFLWKDHVLLHLGAKPRGTIVAVDKATGKEQWRTGEDPAGYSTPMVIEHRGEQQLIQWAPEHVLGFRPDNGEALWKIPYSVRFGVSIAQPIFHEGILLVAGYWHGTRAVRLGEQPKEANLVWSEETELCGLMSQPLYKEGVVYLLDKAQGMTAFELVSGKVLWRDDHQLTPKDRNPQASLVWADEKAGIACGLNALGELVFMRLSREGMEELSRHQCIGKTWAHPAFAGNVVIARSDTEVAAWELWPVAAPAQ